MSVPPVLHAYLETDSTIALVRREGTERIIERVPAEYVAFYATEDLDERMMRELRTSRYVRSAKVEGKWVRVGFVNRQVRRDFCTHENSPFVKKGIKAYEGDIHPIMRLVVDRGIEIAKPRRVYLDLETDSRVSMADKESMRILSWSLVDEQGCVQAGLLESDTDEAERRLLDRLWKGLEPYDQVVAWNGDGFDFPVLWARSRARNVKADANNWLWLDQMILFRRMNLNAAESGEEKRSMKLNSIAQAVVGEGKEEMPPEVVARFGDRSLSSLSYQLWEAGGECRNLLLRYNVKDADLQRRIEDETGYIAVFQSLCELSHIFGDTRSLNPTQQMDGYMLRLGLDRSYHFATKVYAEGEEEREKFRGAYVMEPKCQGITYNVHVADFASLYPSIILTWNMSPDTKRPVPVNGPMPDGFCRSPLTGIGFTTQEEGILPVALGELIRMRKYWSERQAAFPPGTAEHQDAKRKSTAFKVAANSFYGVVGSPFSRFFDKDVAESITQNGVWLIKRTIEQAAAQGMEAIYGDTDSVFVTGATQEQFDAFVNRCNQEVYPELLRRQGCVRNAIKLAYEKAFERLVMPKAKRYCGRWAHYKGKPATADSKPEIKGLEYKRGDAGLLAMNLQAQVIDLLCGGMDKNPGVDVPTTELDRYHSVLSTVRAYVLEGALKFEEVVLSKSLSRGVGEYAQKVKKDGTLSSQPPHVVVAKMLKDRGQDVRQGTRIEYVVTDGSVAPAKVIPAEDYTGHEVDRYHLWESLVYPPTQRLLEAAFPEQDWAAWGRVRPAKPKTLRRGKAAHEGQLSLGGLMGLTNRTSAA